VRSGLAELADAEYQRRVWFGRDSNEMSSFTEAVATLFDDSGLGDALDSGAPIYGLDVDEALRELSALVGNVDVERAPVDVVDDPAMPAVRSLAATILERLEAIEPPG
jgi:hypothetical protein